MAATFAVLWPNVPLVHSPWGWFHHSMTSSTTAWIRSRLSEQLPPGLCSLQDFFVTLAAPCETAACIVPGWRFLES